MRVTDVRDRLLIVLTDDRAKADVVRYFSDPISGADSFSGRLFERFGSGAGRPEAADRFTAEDLLAVQALSVQVPSAAADEILYGDKGKELAAFLTSVPADVDLGTPGAERHVTDDAPAARAWSVLEKSTGIGWVTAGKLMARKRPRLIPVYDDVVRCLLGRPDHAWLDLNHALLDTDVRRKLDEVRAVAPSYVSPLRVLDVVMWMSHRANHAKGECA